MKIYKACIEFVESIIWGVWKLPHFYEVTVLMIYIFLLCGSLQPFLSMNKGFFESIGIQRLFLFCIRELKMQEKIIHVWNKLNTKGFTDHPASNVSFTGCLPMFCMARSPNTFRETDLGNAWDNRHGWKTLSSRTYDW